MSASFSPATDPFSLGTGATPNWLAGYVPPAAEWNSWWSRKVDETDPRLTGGPFLALSGGTMTGELVLAGPPVNALDAVTKAYVDQFTPVTGPFLPQSGGTMTGRLILASNPQGPLDATPQQYVDGVAYTANVAYAVASSAVPLTGGSMSGPLMLYANPSQPLMAATKAYVDGFLPLYGGTISADLHVSGNLEGAAVFVQNILYANAFNNWEWSFGVDAQGSKYQNFRSGWYNLWDGTTGTRYWAAPGQNVMSLDGSGRLAVVGNIVSLAGNLQAAGTVQAVNGGVYAGGAGIVYTNYGGTEYALSWNGTDLLQIINGASSFHLIHSATAGNYVAFYAMAPDVVSGVVVGWITAGYAPVFFPFTWESDRALKSDMRPATIDALAAINAIPTYEATVGSALGPQAPSRHWDCAVIADEVAKVIPAALIPANEEVRYSSLREGPIISTLIRAVQQLTARLDRLDRAAMKA